MTDFDPNAQAPDPNHRWGSYRPDMHGKNREKWKTHSKLQFVRAAIDAASVITVYERVDGVWVERYHHGYGARDRSLIKVDPDTCFVCGEGSQHTYDRLWARWSPDEDFVKVPCHFGCERKLGVRKG